MTSKERILATLGRRSVDHLPVCFEGICHGLTRFVHEQFRDPRQRIDFYLKLGVDVAFPCSPDALAEDLLQTRSWQQRPADEPYPVLHKEYITPAGNRRQVVRWTPDYDHLPAPGEVPHPGKVRLFADQNVPPSRSIEYLVSRPEHLPALRHILQPLHGGKRDAYLQQAKQHRAFCDQRGILMHGYSLGVGDPMIWLSGVEPLLTAAMDEPSFVAEYSALVARWNLANLQLMLDAGCDYIVRRGWYESADFWSPALYRQFLLPHLQAEIALAHQAGTAYAYCMNSGLNPLLPALAEARPDVLCNLDPQAARSDLDLIKKTLGGQMTLCGGINNNHVLERGQPADVIAAVRWAYEHLVPGGGFILAPGDSILETTAVAKDNFHLLIDTWRKITGCEGVKV